MYQIVYSYFEQKRASSFNFVLIKGSSSIRLIDSSNIRVFGVFGLLVLIVLLLSIFSTVSNPVFTDLNRPLLPSPVKSYSTDLPSLDEFENWSWNTITFPYKKLNEADKAPQRGTEQGSERGSERGSTIHLDDYTLLQTGKIQQTNSKVLTFDSSFVDTIYDKVKKLDYPAIEKLMIKQGKTAMALIYDFLSEDAGLITKSVTGFFPTVAVIPLKHTDEDIDILIQKDSAVKEGQLIAKGSECSVHSSLPGKVIDICEQTLADGLKGIVAKIEFSGAFTYTGKKQIPSDWKNYDSNSILMMLKEKGITNTFAKSCCLSNQISNLSETCSRILTVRLFSEDPSRCSDSFITLNFFEKIKTGAYIVAKAMNAKGIVFAYDSSTVFNPDFSDYNQAPVFTVGIDAKSYPCGFMHEIVQAVKNSTKPTQVKADMKEIIKAIGL